jgi:hypothetical protein
MVQKLPELNKKEILVNFDDNSSIFVRRSATVGKVDIIFSRDDANYALYITRAIDKNINYVQAIAIENQVLTMHLNDLGVVTTLSASNTAYYRKK